MHSRHENRLSGILIFAGLVSFIAYVVNSSAVEKFFSEFARLSLKFVG